MNSLILCILALFAAPSALAIKCYLCTPSPPSTLCTSDVTNITDCDTFQPGVPKGTFDACTKRSMEIAMPGDQTLMINKMSCGVKARCKMAEQQVCNQTDPEMTIKKCEFKCCSEDKCNGATATPTSNGFSYAASFTATFMSVLVLSAKFFIH